MLFAANKAAAKAAVAVWTRAKVYEKFAALAFPPSGDMTNRTCTRRVAIVGSGNNRDEHCV